MKRRLFLFLFLLMTLLAVGVLPGFAQSTADIQTFTSSATNVGRSALVNRTARIPVSWTTANRPLTANLIFEQVLPDGSVINVELPRVIPFVASAGDGIAAPILPIGEASTITLRVSLVNMFTNFVYDTEEIVLPIVQGNSGGNGNGSVPALTVYNVDYSAPINRNELNNGTVRLPVSWTAINRPITANLIFEQILPDGRVVNVELPRPFQWVNSSDRGMVAPISVGSEASQIVLRVRLTDLVLNRTYDQLYAYVPIQGSQNAPTITSFNTTTNSVSAIDVARGNTLIDVSWSVSNRPNGTNLVFEQVMPNGNVRNAELPRDVLIVPSSGYGIVAPVLPDQVVDELVFRLRVVDLSNNSTLDSEQLSVELTDIPDGEVVVVTGNACYRDPFAPNRGVSVGEEGRVQSQDNNQAVPIYDDLNYSNVIANLAVGSTFTIKQGPHCSYFTGNDHNSNRRWLITFNGQDGWIEEYDTTFEDDQYVYNFVPADEDDIPMAEILSFSVSPMSVSAADVASTDFTLTWETENASVLFLSFVDNGEVPANKFDEGSIIVDGATIDDFTNEIVFSLIIRDTQDNTVESQIVVPVETSAEINSFTVTPEVAEGNQQISFSWDIAGDYAEAEIAWLVGVESTYTVIHEPDSNTGSFAFTLPDNLPNGERTFSLVVRDNAGANLSEQVQIQYQCPYDWGFSISEEDCPSSALISRTGAYQAFQRGFMVWLPSDSNSMWVFYNDGTAQRYSDTWDGSDVVIDGTPAEGTFAPERGFGHLWNTVPAVRSGLGWATGGEEGYTVNFQETLSYGGYSGKRYYLQLPNTQVIRATHTSASTPLNWQNAD